MGPWFASLLPACKPLSANRATRPSPSRHNLFVLLLPCIPRTYLSFAFLYFATFLYLPLARLRWAHTTRRRPRYLRRLRCCLLSFDLTFWLHFHLLAFSHHQSSLSSGSYLFSAFSLRPSSLRLRPPPLSLVSCASHHALSLDCCPFYYGRSHVSRTRTEEKPRLPGLRQLSLVSAGSPGMCLRGPFFTQSPVLAALVALWGTTCSTSALPASPVPHPSLPCLDLFVRHFISSHVSASSCLSSSEINRFFFVCCL